MNVKINRWNFIDQFRGFAILSMIFVNVCNELPTSSYWLKHHDYGFTFADYVAPAFIFIVGFGYRLSLMKELSKSSIGNVHKKFIKRYCILTFLGFIYGHFDFKVAVWDALTDIGISGLLMYPVMRYSGISILSLGFAYLFLYQIIFSFTSYGKWVMENSIDGGPLGPLSWAFILAYGAFYATLFEKNLLPGRPSSNDIPKTQLSKTLFFWFTFGIITTVLGFFIAYPPFPNLTSIPFTQRGMTISYSIFSSGLCGISIVFFYLLNETAKILIPFINTMGKNPLVLYFLQAVMIFIFLYFIPSELKQLNFFPYALGTSILLICYAVAKILEIKSIYVKV